MHAYGTGTSLRDFGPAVLRLSLGAIFIAHGAQKLFGWGGGVITMSGSAPLILTTGVVEFVGGILLVLGAFTVVSAAALAITMVIAFWRVHLANGFFLNWTLAPGQGHGYEYSLALIGGLVCLALTGPGALSVDGRRAESARAEAAGRARLRAGQV